MTLLFIHVYVDVMVGAIKNKLNAPLIINNVHSIQTKAYLYFLFKQISCIFADTIVRQSHYFQP